MKELITVALEARKHSYSPYSHHSVGAALLYSDGTVYTGCNIENAAYSPSICAERVAFVKAISSQAGGHPVAIAIVGGTRDATSLPYCTPCGVCRQVMREFCRDDFKVITSRIDSNGTILEMRQQTLSELLPDSFGPDNLSR